MWSLIQVYSSTKRKGGIILKLKLKSFNWFSTGFLLFCSSSLLFSILLSSFLFFSYFLDQVSTAICLHCCLISSPYGPFFQLASWEISCCTILTRTSCFRTVVLFLLTHKNNIEAVLTSAKYNSIKAPIFAAASFSCPNDPFIYFSALLGKRAPPEHSGWYSGNQAIRAQATDWADAFFSSSSSSVAFASTFVANAWDVLSFSGCKWSSQLLVLLLEWIRSLFLNFLSQFSDKHYCLIHIRIFKPFSVFKSGVCRIDDLF